MNPQLSDRQYAFLRKAGKRAALIVANFDEKEVECEVVIPRHAFEYLQMTEGKRVVTDLLTDNKSTMMIKADGSHCVNVSGYGAVALCFTV